MTAYNDVQSFTVEWVCGYSSDSEVCGVCAARQWYLHLAFIWWYCVMKRITCALRATLPLARHESCRGEGGTPSRSTRLYPWDFPHGAVFPTTRLCAVGTTATWIQRVFRDTKENIFHYLPSVFHRIEFKYSRSDTFVCALCLTHTANRSQTMFMQQSRGWTFSFIIFHCARRWKCCRDLLLSRLSTCFWIFHAFVGNRIFPF